jgi:hypothetical protein
MEIVKEYPVIFWAVYITFSLLVGSHAKDPYYRSMFGWTILAFLFTPLIALVFLFVAGPPMEARERVEADSAEDLARRKMKAEEKVRESGEMRCTSCSAVVNVTT